MKIIQNGSFILKSLSALRISVDDVLEQLRLAGYSGLEEIDSAIIETNGQISVVPKEKNRPLICSDMNINPSQTYIPYTLISDGKLRKNNLSDRGLSEKWLYKKLGEYNVTDIKKVLYMSVNHENKVFLQIKE